MKNKLRFYSEQEMNILQEFAKSKNPINKKSLAQFCKDYNRSYHAASFKVYDLRKKFGLSVSRPSKNKTTFPVAELSSNIKDKTAVNVSRGEFKIPINSWNVSSENGQFYFIVKF